MWLYPHKLLLSMVSITNCIQLWVIKKITVKWKTSPNKLKCHVIFRACNRHLYFEHKETWRKVDWFYYQEIIFPYSPTRKCSTNTQGAKCWDLARGTCASQSVFTLAIWSADSPMTTPCHPSAVHTLFLPLWYFPYFFYQPPTTPIRLHFFLGHCP